MIQRLGPTDPHWPDDVTQGFQRLSGPIAGRPR